MLSSNFVHILLAPSTKNHHGWRIYATSMSTIRETVNTADLLACPLVSPVNITNSRNCANWLRQNHYWKEWEANRKYLLEPQTLGSQAPVGSGRNFFCRWRCADQVADSIFLCQKNQTFPSLSSHVNSSESPYNTSTKKSAASVVTKRILYWLVKIYPPLILQKSWFSDQLVNDLLLMNSHCQDCTCFKHKL